MQLTHLPLQPKALTLAGESKYGMAIQGQDLRVLDSMHILRAMVFPVVMYGCESWTIKKAERRIIDAFRLWYWIRPLRVP